MAVEAEFNGNLIQNCTEWDGAFRYHNNIEIIDVDKVHGIRFRYTVSKPYTVYRYLVEKKPYTVYR